MRSTCPSPGPSSAGAPAATSGLPAAAVPVGVVPSSSPPPHPAATRASPATARARTIQTAYRLRLLLICLLRFSGPVDDVRLLWAPFEPHRASARLNDIGRARLQVLADDDER